MSSLAPTEKKLGAVRRRLRELRLEHSRCGLDRQRRRIAEHTTRMAVESARKLREENARLREALRAVEWIRVDLPTHSVRACPCCRGVDPSTGGGGHMSCELADALNTAPAASEYHDSLRHTRSRWSTIASHASAAEHLLDAAEQIENAGTGTDEAEETP